MSAGDLAGRFDHSWPTTSRHLRVLVQAGLIRETREGRTRLYVLDRNRVTSVLNLWLPGIGIHNRHEEAP
jgi:DNA-binding transcriptional ArsR family regulator